MCVCVLTTVRLVGAQSAVSQTVTLDCGVGAGVMNGHAQLLLIMPLILTVMVVKGDSRSCQPGTVTHYPEREREKDMK